MAAAEKALTSCKQCRTLLLLCTSPTIISSLFPPAVLIKVPDSLVTDKRRSDKSSWSRSRFITEFSTRKTILWNNVLNVLYVSFADGEFTITWIFTIVGDVIRLQTYNNTAACVCNTGRGREDEIACRSWRNYGSWGVGLGVDLSRRRSQGCLTLEGCDLFTGGGDSSCSS